MHSKLPKVLHEVSGWPMLRYPVQLAKSLGTHRIFTVIGHGGEEVKKRFQGLAEFVWQDRCSGTADAVLRCAPFLKKFSGDVLILCGDTPLIRRETLERLLERHRTTAAHATILTAFSENPAGYGRVVRDSLGAFRTICEDKDATPEHLRIREINTGVYFFSWPRLKEYLIQIRADNKQHEFYLTDAPRLMQQDGLRIETIAASSDDEALGINTRIELSLANKIMNQRLLENYSRSGVNIVDPSATFIEQGVKIGADTTIYPFTYIEKDVVIGNSCSIGPFCKIRSGSVIRDHAVVGSFVEVVRSEIGQHSSVKHLTYLGDARVGRRVNIGAGTITANFNGKKKNKTVIGDGAFIGCDTVLVAPVKIGKKAKTGAGAVIPKGRNVRPGDTVVGVPAQSLSRKREYLRRKRSHKR
ncbi:MAG: NTP transferase domain-containing protein [Candidatus Omnitrophica bacterium]|nr:NTP transferase domain-containing protein [Candidatus Omnitrophota bacterium]